MFGATAVALWWLPDAPKILAFVCTGFDALFVWFAAGLWFTEYRVTLERGLLTVSKRGVAGARAPVQIPLQWIKSVHARGGMQAGNKLYYEVMRPGVGQTHQRFQPAGPGLAVCHRTPTTPGRREGDRRAPRYAQLSRGSPPGGGPNPRSCGGGASWWARSGSSWPTG